MGSTYVFAGPSIDTHHGTMGKPYSGKLKAFLDTHDWTMTVQLSGLSRFVNAARFLPMHAAGSGGSLVAAAFAAMLHRWTAFPARYVHAADDGVRAVKVRVHHAAGVCWRAQPRDT